MTFLRQSVFGFVFIVLATGGIWAEPAQQLKAAPRVLLQSGIETYEQDQEVYVICDRMGEYFPRLGDVVILYQTSKGQVEPVPVGSAIITEITGSNLTCRVSRCTQELRHQLLSQPQSFWAEYGAAYYPYTPTPTSTFTPTVTATPSLTKTPTPSQTKSPTPTRTKTLTPTQTISPSPTNSPTLTATLQAKSLDQQPGRSIPQNTRPAPTHRPGEVRSLVIEGTKEISFVWIPPQMFQLGTADDLTEQVETQLEKWTETEVSQSNLDDGHLLFTLMSEYPPVEVELDGYWISRTEVTNEQYRALSPDHNSGRIMFSNLNGELQPVVNVTWHEAADYAENLSQYWGESVLLPTEAQWEAAAECGNYPKQVAKALKEGKNPPGNVRDFLTASIFGDEKSGFKFSDGFVTTAPCGHFPPSPCGVFDMLGNVSEWCRDTYQRDWFSTLERGVRNPCATNMISNSNSRVVRGSNWGSAPEWTRLTLRSHLPSEEKAPMVGFRLVIEP